MVAYCFITLEKLVIGYILCLFIAKCALYEGSLSVYGTPNNLCLQKYDIESDTKGAIGPGNIRMDQEADWNVVNGTIYRDCRGMMRWRDSLRRTK